MSSVLLPPIHPSALPAVSVSKEPPARAIVESRADILRVNASVKKIADRTLGLGIVLGMCGLVFSEPLIYGMALLGVAASVYAYAWLRTTGAASTKLLAPVTGSIRAELAEIVAASPIAREYCVRVSSQKRPLTALELRALGAAIHRA
jgi:hypothetical protein